MKESNFLRNINILSAHEQKETRKIISLDKLEKLALDKGVSRKKILLIDGTQLYLKEGNKERRGYFFHSKNAQVTDYINFGIFRIAGYLDKYNVPTRIIRLQDFNSDDKKDELRKIIIESDILGMSALSPSIDKAFKFCLDVKKEFPDKMIVGGAEHFALDYEWILQNKKITGIDVCCTKQGELPILALAVGVPKEEIGSVAYITEENGLTKNQEFDRLKESCDFEIGKPVPARSMEKEWMPMIFPEMSKYFKYCGSTQTGSGCAYSCDFCTNENFLGKGVANTMGTAEKEIENLYNQGVDFMFVRDALLNASRKHFREFIEFMKKSNDDHANKMGWFAFMSVKKDDELRKFKEMAKAGCIMIGVGVEDVVGQREELHKGADLETAISFIDTAKEDLLVRALLIMGLPIHYNYSREEIKETTLQFMKKHPQGIYRLNLWTPIIGTEDFKSYGSVLEKDIRKDVSSFKEHDTMHSVVDPQKMYEKLSIPEEKRWVKTSEDWIVLRNEIVKEYLESKEHDEFLESLKDREILGQKGLLFNIANDFKNITLNGLDSYNST